MPRSDEPVPAESGTSAPRSGNAGLIFSASAIGATVGAVVAFAVGGVFSSSGEKIQADAFTPPRPPVEIARRGQPAENDPCAGQTWPNFSQACVDSKGRVAAKAPAVDRAPLQRSDAAPVSSPPPSAPAETASRQSGPERAQPVQAAPPVAATPPPVSTPREAGTSPTATAPRVAETLPAAPAPAARPTIETTGSIAPSARASAPRSEPELVKSEPEPKIETKLETKSEPTPRPVILSEDDPPPAAKKPAPKKRAKAKPRRRETDDDDPVFERRTTERSYDRADSVFGLRGLEPRESRGRRFIERDYDDDDNRSRRRRVIVIERGSDDFFGQLFRF